MAFSEQWKVEERLENQSLFWQLPLVVQKSHISPLMVQCYKNVLARTDKDYRLISLLSGERQLFPFHREQKCCY